jgi:hypothetical protein
MLKTPRNKKMMKRLLLSGGVLLLAGLAVYFYFASLTHEDTARVKVDFNVEAVPFIKEFEKDYQAANKKYAEKIISVKGIVTAALAADTTINIEMKDTATGSYLIFAFQEQHMTAAKAIKKGELIRIKGSCSDGIYSDILGTYAVSFKRCVIDQ